MYVPHTSDNTAPENGWYPPSTVTDLTVWVYALWPVNGAGTTISYVLSYRGTSNSYVP